MSCFSFVLCMDNISGKADVDRMYQYFSIKKLDIISALPIYWFAQESSIANWGFPNCQNIQWQVDVDRIEVECINFVLVI